MVNSFKYSAQERKDVKEMKWFEHP